MDWNPKNWQSVARQEYPPQHLIVWTSDRTHVRKGTWHWEPPAPLEEGAWHDETAAPIKVTHWCPIEDSPDNPPPLPPLATGPETVVVAIRTRPPP